MYLALQIGSLHGWYNEWDIQAMTTLGIIQRIIQHCDVIQIPFISLKFNKWW